MVGLQTGSTAKLVLSLMISLGKPLQYHLAWGCHFCLVKNNGEWKATWQNVPQRGAGHQTLCSTNSITKSNQHNFYSAKQKYHAKSLPESHYQQPWLFCHFQSTMKRPPTTQPLQHQQPQHQLIHGTTLYHPFISPTRTGDFRSDAGPATRTLLVVGSYDHSGDTRLKCHLQWE